MAVNHPRNPPRDYDPGNGKGYWAYGPSERERNRWIPPRPADFPGDEAAWYANQVFGVPPSVTSLPRASNKELTGESLTSFWYGFFWAVAAFVSVQVFFSIVHEDISSGMSILVSLVFALITGVISPITRRHPYITGGAVVGATLLQHFLKRKP